MKFNVGDIVLIKEDKEKELWEIEEFQRDNPRIVKLKGKTNRSIIYAYVDELIKPDKKIIEEILEECSKYFHKFISAIKKDGDKLISKNNQGYSSHNNLDGGETKAVLNPQEIQTEGQSPAAQGTEGSNGQSDENKLLIKKPGSILHLDTDQSYMNKCLEKYKEMGIPAVGYALNAPDFPSNILKLLEKEQPNVLVITGHDQLINNKKPFELESYLYSKFYVEAVRIARKFDRNKNSLVIFAGACNSHFEALMEAGANFASSPMRVKIADLDPAVIAIIIAMTPIITSIDILKAISYTKAGIKGIGGIESEGTLRDAAPKESYSFSPVSTYGPDIQVAMSPVEGFRKNPSLATWYFNPFCTEINWITYPRYTLKELQEMQIFAANQAQMNEYNACMWDCIVNEGYDKVKCHDYCKSCGF